MRDFVDRIKNLYGIRAGRTCNRGRVSLFVVSAVLSFLSCAADKTGWDRVPDILRRMEAPAFPGKDFVITRYGARGDSATDCTEAFRSAVDLCHAAGGGRVVVPSGTYLTGPIRLKSNVNLHLSEGAVVSFFADPRRLLPVVLTRYEGNPCYNFSPLVLAYRQRNLAVTGKGRLVGNGNAAVWEDMNSKKKADSDTLRAMGERGTPVEKRIFGDGHFLRPSMIEPMECENILIEGITVEQGPMWVIHPVLCRNVAVRNVTVRSNGPNNDGCDPESCRDVLIENCAFFTRDDGIAVKSGRNADGRRIGVPSENIVIRYCRFEAVPESRNGMAVGSEVSGGVRNVFVERCTMNGRNQGIYIKSNRARGGIVEQVYFRDITINGVRECALAVSMHYGRERGDCPPVFRDIQFRDIRCDRGNRPILVVGQMESPVRDALFEDCAFQNMTRPMEVENAANLVMKNVRINNEQISRVINTPATLPMGDP